MADSFKDMKDNEMFELTSALQMLTANIRDMMEGTTEHSEAVEKDIEELEKRRKKAKELNEADTKLKKAKDEYKKSVDKAKDSLKKLGSELVQIIDAGVKFSATVGTTATKGVELEIKNRLASVSSLLKFNADLAVSAEQIQAAQQGLTDAFISTKEGFQLSAQGSKNFVQSLKQGFKSEFEPTAETFKMLTQMGMSTTTQFDAFRRATGRASLSNNQLATLYNKNQLSFLLYGNSFGKAAVQAERLGINLASIQSAQESLVTNLDGTIDTVAQINQLGGSIDFSELVRISEQEGPDALMAYVRATVPEYMMQSASTRALFKQLGVSVEDYMKSGEKQQSAADELERQMTEAAEETSGFTKAATKFATFLGTAWGILTSTFGALGLAAWNAFFALRAMSAAASANAAAAFLKPGGAPPAAGMGMLGRFGLGAAGVGIGLGGIAYGSSLVAEGKTGAGVGIGAAAGGIGALLTAAAILGAIPTGGLSLALLAGGAALGAGASYGIGTSMRTGGDVIDRPGKSAKISREGSLVENLAGLGGNLTQVGELTRGVRGAGFLSGIFDTLQYSEKYRNNPTTAATAKNLPYSSLLVGLSMAGVIGGVGLTAAALAGTIFTGGMAPLIIGALASMGTSAALDKWLIGNDVMSMPSGYGDRILLTPEGPIALNNKDTVMAFADDAISSGTTRFPLGYLAAIMGGQQNNNSVLVKKVENLIDVIASSTTEVSIDNQVVHQPRMAMAGVRFRNNGS